MKQNEEPQFIGPQMPSQWTTPPATIPMKPLVIPNPPKLPSSIRSLKTVPPSSPYYTPPYDFVIAPKFFTSEGRLKALVARWFSSQDAEEKAMLSEACTSEILRYKLSPTGTMNMVNEWYIPRSDSIINPLPEQAMPFWMPTAEQIQRQSVPDYSKYSVPYYVLIPKKEYDPAGDVSRNIDRLFEDYFTFDKEAMNKFQFRTAHTLAQGVASKHIPKLIWAIMPEQSPDPATYGIQTPPDGIFGTKIPLLDKHIPGFGMIEIDSSVELSVGNPGAGIRIIYRRD